LTTLNFNRQLLTMHTFTEVYRRMRSNSTPALVYGAKMHSRSCDYWVYGSDTPLYF